MNRDMARRRARKLAAQIWPDLFDVAYLEQKIGTTWDEGYTVWSAYGRAELLSDKRKFLGEIHVLADGTAKLWSAAEIKPPAKPAEVVEVVEPFEDTTLGVEAIELGADDFWTGRYAHRFPGSHAIVKRRGGRVVLVLSATGTVAELEATAEAGAQAWGATYVPRPEPTTPRLDRATLLWVAVAELIAGGLPAPVHVKIKAMYSHDDPFLVEITTTTPSDAQAWASALSMPPVELLNPYAVSGHYVHSSRSVAPGTWMDVHAIEVLHYATC